MIEHQPRVPLLHPRGRQLPGRLWYLYARRIRIRYVTVNGNLLRSYLNMFQINDNFMVTS